MTVADFWRFCAILSRRRWVVLTTMIATMTLVGVGCALLPRYYRASALVMPSEDTLQQPGVSGASLPGSDSRTLVGAPERAQQLSNLLFIAESQEVLRRAAKSAGLALSPPDFQDRVTIEPLPNSTMLNISVMLKDPEQAKRAANALAQEFAAFYREVSERETIKNRKFLEGELRKSREQLAQAERALAAYKREVEAEPLQLAAVEGDRIELERDSTEAQLRETGAKAAALRRQLQGAPETVVSEEGSTDNPVVTDLQRQLATVESDLAAEQAIHQDKHPRVISLRAQRDELQSRIRSQMSQVIKHTTVSRNPLHARLVDDLSRYEADRVALQAKLSALSAVSNRRSLQKRQQSAQGVRMAALLREYRVAEEAYTRLKASVDQARINESISSNTDVIRIVDMARSARGPMTKGPSPLQIAIIGLILSLAMGVGLALAMDVLDNRLQTADQVQHLLELPVSGLIPEIAGYSPLQLPQVTALAPGSSFAEAYRFLRTDLLFESGERKIRSVMVATARPGQGGTTTVSNLAISLAEAGKRVILVDADMRRPSLHQIFAVPNDIGLAAVLSGEAELVDALRPTRVENLLVLPAGPPAANASALINSARMRDLVSRLAGECDFVLFDTPSAAVFSDAAVLSAMVDGVFIVVRAQQSPQGNELQVRGLLNKAGAHVLGVVLNDVPPERVDSVRYHESYYPERPALVSGQPEAPALPQTAAQEQEMPRALEAPAHLPTASAASARNGTGWKTGMLVAALIAVVGIGAWMVLGAGKRPQPARPAAEHTAVIRPGVVVVGNVTRGTAVRVLVDGEVLYEGDLLPGRFEWKGKREVTIHVQDPGAIAFTHNGRRLGTLGAAGDSPIIKTFTAGSDRE